MADKPKQRPKTRTVKVRYQGLASVRSFTEEDFTRHGIDDQGEVEFNHDNRWVAEVSPEAAGFLVGSGEFVKVRSKSNMAERPSFSANKAEWQEAVSGMGGTVTDDMTIADLEAEYDRLEAEQAQAQQPDQSEEPGQFGQSRPESSL